MATFTMSLTSNAATGSKTWNLSEADAAALVNYLQIRFSEEGGPLIPPLQALNAWVNHFVGTTTVEVRRQQIQQQAAQINPPPINFN